MIYFYLMVYLFQDSFLSMFFVSILSLQQVAIFLYFFQNYIPNNWIPISSYFFLSFSLVGAIIAFIVVSKFRQRLEHVKKRIGSFYEGLEVKHPRLLFTMMIFYIKRVCYCFILLFLESYPVLQIFGCLFLSGFHIAYLIYQKPMEGPMEQFFEVFNEILVFITTASVLCFTDAYEDLSQKRNAGAFACGVIFVLIIGNLTGLVINVYSSLKKAIIKLLLKIRRKKQIQSQDQQINFASVENSSVKIDFSGKSSNNLRTINEIEELEEFEEVKLEKSKVLNKSINQSIAKSMQFLQRPEKISTARLYNYQEATPRAFLNTQTMDGNTTPDSPMKGHARKDSESQYFSHKFYPSFNE